MALLAWALVLALPVLPPLVRVGEARRTWQVAGASDPIERLAHAPLRPEEREAFEGLQGFWRRHGKPKGRVFTVNRRNDLAFANEAIVYWFLDARPASWATTFDPGLADRGSVQRRTARDLCETRAPVVQLVGPHGQTEFEPFEHFSRYLDQYLALNYRAVGTAGLYRFLLPEVVACTFPERATQAEIERRREVLLTRDELPEAGALSVLLVERATAKGRLPTAEVLAGAGLGGYWVLTMSYATGPRRSWCRHCGTGRARHRSMLAHCPTPRGSSAWQPCSPGLRTGRRAEAG